MNNISLDVKYKNWDVRWVVQWYVSLFIRIVVVPHIRGPHDW